MGGYGIGGRNREGERILEFWQVRDLRVVNTMFKKDREKRITYKSGGGVATQVDFVLERRTNLIVRDCKVIPGEACIPQYRLLCTDLVVKNMGRIKKKKEATRIKE